MLHWRLMQTGALRILCIVASAALVGVFCFSRAFQVVLFLSAAGIRKVIHSSANSRPGDHAMEWDDIRPPTGAPPIRSSRFAITHHPWYQFHHARASCICLEQAAALGVGYVRSDVRWKDVLPDGQTVDQNAFRWYRSYFTAVRDWYGLQPLLVLSEAPRSVHRMDKKARSHAWRYYVEEVVARLGDLCRVYQVLNEPNNPVYRSFPKDEQFGAIRSGAAVIKAAFPDARIAVNFLVGMPGWRRSLTAVLEQCGPEIDIVTVDYYPGTWSVSLNQDWVDVVDLARKVSNPSMAPLWAGRKLGIMETGYATNLATLFRTEAQQANYFLSFGKTVSLIDDTIGSTGLELVGLYELSDDNTASPLDPEAHFGLLTSDLTRKSAFGVVQRLCSEAAQADSRPILEMKLP